MRQGTHFTNSAKEMCINKGLGIVAENDSTAVFFYVQMQESLQVSKMQAVGEVDEVIDEDISSHLFIKSMTLISLIYLD